MGKCEVCAIPYGETTCVTCGAKAIYHCPHCHVEGEQEHGVDCPLYGVEVLKPEVMTVQEGVQVEPAPCGKCGRMTVSRIESKDGQVGCLECLMDFLVGPPVYDEHGQPAALPEGREGSSGHDQPRGATGASD